MNIVIVFQAATLEAGDASLIGYEVGLSFQLLEEGFDKQLTMANAGWQKGGA